MERWFGRYWGYPVFAVVLSTWLVLLGGVIPHAGVFPLVLIIALSVLQALYFLFRVPMWCGARTRAGLRCRNNSTGVLLGCHLREHKWQRLKMVVMRERWRELYAELFETPKQGFATICGLVALLSTLVSTIGAILKMSKVV
jgi:hypothetical protein